MTVSGPVGTFKDEAFTSVRLNPKPPACKAGALPLSYRPLNGAHLSDAGPHDDGEKNPKRVFSLSEDDSETSPEKKKGGDPSAGSPTDTL